jgi:hypothetical protein
MLPYTKNSQNIKTVSEQSARARSRLGPPTASDGLRAHGPARRRHSAPRPPLPDRDALLHTRTRGRAAAPANSSVGTTHIRMWCHAPCTQQPPRVDHAPSPPPSLSGAVCPVRHERSAPAPYLSGRSGSRNLTQSPWQKQLPEMVAPRPPSCCLGSHRRRRARGVVAVVVATRVRPRLRMCLCSRGPPAPRCELASKAALAAASAKLSTAAGPAPPLPAPPSPPVAPTPPRLVLLPAAAGTTKNRPRPNAPARTSCRGAAGVLVRYVWWWRRCCSGDAATAGCSARQRRSRGPLAEENARERLAATLAARSAPPDSFVCARSSTLRERAERPTSPMAHASGGSCSCSPEPLLQVPAASLSSIMPVTWTSALSTPRPAATCSENACSNMARERGPTGISPASRSILRDISRGVPPSMEATEKRSESCRLCRCWCCARPPSASPSLLPPPTRQRRRCRRLADANARSPTRGSPLLPHTSTMEPQNAELSTPAEPRARPPCGSVADTRPRPIGRSAGL